MAAGTKWVKRLKQCEALSGIGPKYSASIARLQLGGETVEPSNRWAPDIDTVGLHTPTRTYVWDLVTFLLLFEGEGRRPTYSHQQTFREESENMSEDAKKEKWLTLLEGRGIARNGLIDGSRIAVVSAGHDIETTHFLPYAYDNDFLYIKRDTRGGRTIEGFVPWDQISQILFR